MQPRWQNDPVYRLRMGLDEHGRPLGQNQEPDGHAVDTAAARPRRHIASSSDESSNESTSPSPPNANNNTNNNNCNDGLIDTDEEATIEENHTVPVAQEPPSQNNHTTTNTREEEGRQAENNAAMTTAVETSSTAMAVFVCSKKCEATARDLFETSKRNIRIEDITYTCSHVKQLSKKTIKKIYQCANVKDPRAGWIPKPGYRNPRKPTNSTVILEKCKGRIEGNFSKSSFFFGAAEGHTCTIKNGGRRSDLDLRPPLLVITAAESWGITNTLLSKMKDTLKNTPEGWWRGLPNQGRNREWLKQIGDATTPSQISTKKQIEATLQPFLRYITSIYPEMRYYKVGALRTRANTTSQYEMSNNTFHTDYSDDILNRPPRERPMSIIMALDSFSFLVKPTVPTTPQREYNEITVEPGQAITFTYEQLHAGGPHTGTEYIYRLFAYIVCHEADYPNNLVSHNTPARKRKRKSSTRNNNEQLDATTNTGRARKSANYKA